MHASLRTKVIAICDDKIAKKGEKVGLTLYAFFANKSDEPEVVFEAATWWMRTHQLNHFEKAVKIHQMLASNM